MQDEYIKAYYEALKKRQEEEDAKRMQQEGQTFSSETHSERQLGMKTKREDVDIEDEGVEWEEHEHAGILSFCFASKYNLMYTYACSDSKLSPSIPAIMCVHACADECKLGRTYM